MAAQNNYVLQFRSLRTNELYTVKIDGGSGVPFPLIGSDQPLETQEDNEEDFFLPVRRQSGYLRIMTRDESGQTVDWSDLIPDEDTSRPVTVTNEAMEVVWMGYIQPQSFSGGLYKSIETMELPLMCPLHVLEGVDVYTGKVGVITFGNLLYDIIIAMGQDLVWDYVNFSGDEDIIKDWLSKKVDYQNFLSQDDNGNTVAKYTYYDLLQEVCKFFGWTCRIFGTQIFFMSPDESFPEDYVGFTVDDLFDIGSARAQIGEYNTADIDDDVYASDDNNISYIRGVRKATVTAEINKQDSVLSIPFDEIKERYRKLPVDGSRLGDIYFFIIEGYESVRKWSNVLIDLFQSQDGNRAYYLLSDTWDKDIALKHNYNWEPSLVVIGGPWDFCAKISSLSPMNFDHGMLYITGNVKASTNGELNCAVSIGDLFWNGSSWTHIKSYITIYFGNFDSTAEGGKINDTRILNSPYPAYEGYGIPIDTAIGGIVTLEIQNIDVAPEHHVGYITSLSIGFVRHNDYAPYSERNKNTYISDNGTVFKEEKNIDLIFATDAGNARGLGIVMNQDGSYCDGLEYGNFFGHPEQHLADRITAYGRKPRVCYDVELRQDCVDDITDNVGITPYHKIQTPGPECYPVAISRRWYDDVTVLKLMEI